MNPMRCGLFWRGGSNGRRAEGKAGKRMFSRDTLTYAFHNVDLLFDFLLGIGMKPFIEFGFMPRALASGTATCFHYQGNITPPADYEAWGTLIKTLTAHLADRYGVAEIRTWFFEVWNEPNLKYFWKGDKLASHAVAALVI